MTSFLLISLIRDFNWIHPKIKWQTPDELLQMYQEKRLWLPPPQFAELRRLSTVGSIDKLVEIAKSRNGSDMQIGMPVQFKSKDGFIHVLPGDDLYPKNPNYHDR